MGVTEPKSFPEDLEPEILINNAGVQNSGRDIDINLKGTINMTERYAIGNEKIKAVVNISNVSRLPLGGAIALIIISVLLTIIAGLIPSRYAAKRDPVEALRTE